MYVKFKFVGMGVYLSFATCLEVEIQHVCSVEHVSLLLHLNGFVTCGTSHLFRVLAIYLKQEHNRKLKFSM